MVACKDRLELNKSFETSLRYEEYFQNAIICLLNDIIGLLNAIMRLIIQGLMLLSSQSAFSSLFIHSLLRYQPPL